MRALPKVVRPYKLTHSPKSHRSPGSVCAMTSEPVLSRHPGRMPWVHAARSDDSLRQLIALAALSLDMAGASVSLRAVHHRTSDHHSRV